MFFFLGEKMMVTGSGEGKQPAGTAELPNPNVQINAAGIGLLAFRRRTGALDGRSDFGGLY
jgi:hypothetical protein